MKNIKLLLPLLFLSFASQAQYCAAGASFCDEYISNVTVAGINNTTGCGLISGYSDYSTITGTMSVGFSYPISVTNPTPYTLDYVYIWVDWNNNGTFGDVAGEYFATTTTNNALFSGTILCPAGTSVGQKRMRIRISYNVSPGSPCGTEFSGEVEDYMINVTNGSGSPIITLNPVSQIICAGNAVSFTATATGATNIQWQVSTNNGTIWTDIAGATSSPITFNVSSAQNGNLFRAGFINLAGTTYTSAATLTVNISPSLSVPADITTSNTAGQCGKIVTYTTTSTGTPSPTISYSLAGATTASGNGNGSGNLFNVGITTVTVTSSNTCGSDSKDFIVTITDADPPTITCPAPVTVNCASAVPAPNIASVTASDNCPGVVVTHRGDVISNQTCANRYTITRTYRATDAGGNFTECTQIITVNDITAPTLTCPASVTVSCAANVPAPNIASVTGVSDNCAGAVTVTHVSDVISNQTCANRFTITRTYRATDVCGNFTECTQTITVNDQTAPVITCPASVTVNCASAVPAPNIALVTATDNCGGPVTITYISDVISNQTCANRYTIARTYRATDVCGNSSECTQIITVNDITPPTLTCPAPITVGCAANVPVPNIASVTGVSDNCSGAVTVTFVSDVISNQTCANRYTIIRTYRATDICGNFAECSQLITVNDQTAPVITCPANISTTTPVGSCTAVVNYTVTATDNCSGAINIVNVPASGSSFPIGITTVTSTATDLCGNSSICSFTVTVTDGQLPVITIQPSNKTVCAGDNASFTVVSTNTISYQWQLWNGNNWTDIAGATGSTMIVNNAPISLNNKNYRVKITGLCTTIFSNPVWLYVNPLPTIMLSASPVPVIMPGQATSITATVNPPGGSIIWFKDGIAIPGATGLVLANLRVDDLGTYKAAYTDLNGCTSTSVDEVVGGMYSEKLFVYPNPNKGQFQIRFYNKSNEKVVVNIYNSQGERIFSRELITGNNAYSKIDVDISRMTPGLYCVSAFNSLGERVGVKWVMVNR